MTSTNVSLGYSSMAERGGCNTAIGTKAGHYFGSNTSNSTTQYNTFLGYCSDISGSNFNYSTAIGSYAKFDADHQIRIGTPAETVQIDGSLNVYGTTTIYDTFNVIGYGVVSTLNVRNDANITGNVISNGYRCRSGLGGTLGNMFNTYWNGSSLQFYIDSTLVGTSFSDYRSKTNITDSSGVLERLCNLKMFNYNYKDVGIINGDDKVRLGFFAHELQETLPEYADIMVNGKKDGVDETGSPILQSINNMDTVLLKAIQELNDKVELLTKNLQETNDKNVVLSNKIEEMIEKNSMK